MFHTAKAFSDFIGFHVRLQFVLLSAAFILTPVALQLNHALKTGSAFATSAGPVDYVAVVGLLLYGMTLMFFICATGCIYLWQLLLRLTFGIRVMRYILAIPICIAFVAFELAVNGGVLLAGSGRIWEAYGVEASEISELNRMLWERACLRGTSECP